MEEGALREGPPEGGASEPAPRPFIPHWGPGGAGGQCEGLGEPTGPCRAEGSEVGTPGQPRAPLPGLNLPRSHSPSHRPRSEPMASRGSVLRGDSPAQGGVGARRSNTPSGHQRETQAAGALSCRVKGQGSGSRLGLAGLRRGKAAPPPPPLDPQGPPGLSFSTFKMMLLGTFLVVQWLRLCLPVQRRWILSLLKERISHKPHGQQNKTKQKQCCNKFKKDLKNKK